MRVCAYEYEHMCAGTFEGRRSEASNIPGAAVTCGCEPSHVGAGT